MPHRRDVHDRAFDAVAQHDLDDALRKNDLAVQVRARGRLQFFSCRIREAHHVGTVDRVVDEHVDLSVFRIYGVDQRLNGFVARKIKGHAAAVEALFPERRRVLLALCTVSRCDHDCRARFAHTFGNGGAVNTDEISGRSFLLLSSSI